MAKKVSRKDLLKTPDEFFTISGKLIQFAVANKMAIMCAFGTVLAIVAAVSVMKYVSNKSEDQSFTMLAEAVAEYQKTENKVENKSEEDKAKAFETAEKQFRKIIDEYPKKKGGMLARAVFANICNDAQKYDMAIELYKESLVDFEEWPSMKNMILSGLAHAHIDKKDFDSAVGYFEKIASDSNSIMKEDAYVNLWRLYAMKSDTAKSQANAEKLIKDFPESIYIEVVKEAEKKESTTEAVKTEPATEAGKTEPATETEKTEPSTETEKTEPATDAVKTEPATDAVKTEPATEAVKTEPSTETEKTEPATDAVKTEPATDAVKTEPATETGKTDS